MKIPSVRNILDQALRTILRFPVELLVAAIGTILVMRVVFLSDLNWLPHDQELIYRNAIFSCVLVMNIALTLSIVAETRIIKQLVRWIGLAVLGCTIIWFTFSLGEGEWNYMLFAAAALTVHFAVALSASLKRSQQEFWEFNKTLFLRVLMGALFTGVLIVGCIIALFALKELFGLDIADWMFGWTVAFFIGIFNTVLVLGGVPEIPKETLEETLEETKKGNIKGTMKGTLEGPGSIDSVGSFPKGLRVFVQFVLVPLIVLFLVILYAYGTKVLFFSDLKGSVSGFILLLSIVGTLAYLLVHPLRNDEKQRWVKKLGRGFGLVMLPLSALLWFAICLRVLEFGITEQRYAVVCLALCQTFIAIYFAWSRNPDIRFVPAIVGIVCLIAFASPFNLADLSFESQISRLTETVNRYHLVQNGKVDSLAFAKLSVDETKDLRSVVEYLYSPSDSTRLTDALLQLGASPLPQATNRDSVFTWFRLENDAKWWSIVKINFDELQPAMENLVNNGSVQPFSFDFDAKAELPGKWEFHSGGTWNIRMIGDRVPRWVIVAPNHSADTISFGDFLYPGKTNQANSELKGSIAHTANFQNQSVRFVYDRLEAHFEYDTCVRMLASGMIIVERK